jgi:hypothetical protein
MSETEQPQEQTQENQPQEEQTQENQPQEEQPQEQTDQERFDQEQQPDSGPVEDESATEPHRPKHAPLENAGLDQHAAEEQRQAELAEERQTHNERTGDASR